MFPFKNIPQLSERLKYLRRIKNLTQAELAAMAETTQQAIQQAEAGKSQNPRYLHKLSRALNVPFEWLAMNIPPDEVPAPKRGGLAEKGRDVLNTFYSMPKEDQDLILRLMKNRKDG